MTSTPDAPRSERPLIIYHADCVDGFAAAWAASCAFPADRYVELCPAVYREPPPDVTGREVYVVDFSYPREVLVEMHARAKYLLVVDHHKTAAADLEGLPFCVFDMARSGAGLAWDVLAAPTRGARPWLIDYVEDRDLWRWALPESRAVNAYLGSIPHTLEAFERTSADSLVEVALLGHAVLLAQARYIDRTVACARVRSMEVCANTPGARGDGFFYVDVPVVNAGPWLVSEVLELLKQRHPEAPFVAAWYERSDGTVYYSLRSDGAGADVGEIARSIYAGGGHRNAAGFDEGSRVDFDPLVMP